MPQITKTESGRNKRFLKEFSGYIIAIFSAIVLATIIRIFIMEPFVVPTPSMEPTLKVGDKVIINKLVYKFRTVKRGDIVAFHSPVDNDKDLVKRVVAVEGDLLTLTGDGSLFINDELLIEDYIYNDSNLSYNDYEILIENNHIFVMGDNRNNSIDSRYFGTISKDEIFGKLLVVYWPPSSWGR